MMGAEFRYRANFTFSMRWAKIAKLGICFLDRSAWLGEEAIFDQLSERCER
jgi:hypothetical protein